MYHLTPKGCLILASGYNAVLREKIIDRLFELEAKERQYKPLSAYPMLTTERKKAEELMSNTSMEVLEDASLPIENHILRRKLQEAGIEYKERVF
nr:MAG TPA: regulatory protein [Bacteriophage sp.]